MSNLNERFKIVDFLASRKLYPVAEKAGELLYYSPLKTESTPSFFVNITKNRFNDFSTGENGDIFRLVMLIEQVVFKEALEILKNQSEQLTFSFSGYNPIDTHKVKILNVIPITKRFLIQYVAKRGIDLDLARNYVSEVHYSTNGRNWYALGFKNDSGGYELRNALDFKTKSINDISTISTGSDRLSLFEGFFDFLSALQYYQLDKPNTETIVMNSISNIDKVLSLVSQYSETSSFLDNDQAGIKAFKQIEGLGVSITNYSELIYPEYKDFNAYLMGKG